MVNSEEIDELLSLEWNEEESKLLTNVISHYKRYKFWIRGSIISDISDLIKLVIMEKRKLIEYEKKQVN